MAEPMDTSLVPRLIFVSSLQNGTPSHHKGSVTLYI